MGKVLRALGLVCLILLAGLGIGITGVGPVQPRLRHKLRDYETQSEQVEEQTEQARFKRLQQLYKRVVHR